MKIVLIGPVYPYRGGIAHYTTMLARALRAHGHQVLLVSFKRQYPQWLFPGTSDRDPSPDPLVIEDAQYWIDSLNPLTWLTTFERVRRYQPDAIVLQWWTTFWMPMLLVLGLLDRLFLRSLLIYICHNVLPHDAHPLDSVIARLALRWGRRFVVQSQDEQQRLLRLIPNAEVHVASLPIYNMFADRPISQAEARQRLGLSLARPMILFFGIVREYKGLKHLLSAVALAKARLPQLQLLVAGEFWEDKAEYLQLITSLGIVDNVYIDDRYIPNAEVPWFFLAADVLVAPYQSVTGSAVIQMARGFQLPVITTDLKGLVEVIEDGKTGFIVPVGDVQALADVLVRYFQESWRETMSSAMAQSANLFSWEALSALLEQMIVAVN